MSKTFKYDPRSDKMDQQSKKQAKQDKKVQGRSIKQFWRNLSTQDKE